MSWQEWRPFLEAVLSIFVIVNPIGNLPVLAGLTEGVSDRERQRVFQLAGVVALCIICAFAIAGEFLMLDVFHIELPEFTFGGGLMLVVIAIRNMLVRPQYRAARPPGAVPEPAQVTDEEVTLAVSPIAFPLLVGPGSIVTVMLIVNRSGMLLGVLASVVAFLFVLMILRWSNVLLRLLGHVGALAVGRVLQIFIVAIGMHFIFQAIRAAFPCVAR